MIDRDRSGLHRISVVTYEANDFWTGSFSFTLSASVVSTQPRQ